jgi:hypothetical protein
MKSRVLILLIFFISQIAVAQSIKIGLNTGYGTYQMKDLKEFQSDAAEYYKEFNIEEVQQFPGYINYSASLEYSFGTKNLIGLNAAYVTTGGRNHVADYTGEYYLNMPVYAYSLGMQYRRVVTTINKFDLYAQVRGGISFSTLEINESFTIHQVDSTSSSFAFVNHSFFAEPSVGTFYALGKDFSINFSLGYQIDTKSKLYYKDNKEETFLGFDGKPIYTNWSGLRIVLGLSYDLFKE